MKNKIGEILDRYIEDGIANVNDKIYLLTGSDELEWKENIVFRVNTMEKLFNSLSRLSDIPGFEDFDQRNLDMVADIREVME